MAIVEIVREPPDINDVVEEMRGTSGREGAIVAFLGFVKRIVGDELVTRFEFKTSSLEEAVEELKSIAEREESNGVTEVRIYHRIGVLEPGSPTLYVFVKAVNRKLAFRAAERIVDALKEMRSIRIVEDRVKLSSQGSS